MKIFAIVALCIVAASAGVVDHTVCGGNGRTNQVRISDCEGPIADMTPGLSYITEADIVPAGAAPQLRLKVTTVFFGQTIIIIDSVLENSAVQPGSQYTVRWTITPSTLLSGNTVPVKTEISNEANQVVEVCITIQARIA